MLIFQPAEEIGLGAQAMIEDGALKLEPIDVIYGFHNYPTSPYAQRQIKPTP